MSENSSPFSHPDEEQEWLRLWYETSNGLKHAPAAKVLRERLKRTGFSLEKLWSDGLTLEFLRKRKAQMIEDARCKLAKIRETFTYREMPLAQVHTGAQRKIPSADAAGDGYVACLGEAINELAREEENKKPLLVTPKDSKETATETRNVISFGTDCFFYRMHRETLKGKSLLALKAIVDARKTTISRINLEFKVWPDYNSSPENISSVISTIRTALRKAIAAVGTEFDGDPLPNVEKGTEDSGWRLNMP